MVNKESLKHEAREGGYIVRRDVEPPLGKIHSSNLSSEMFQVEWKSLIETKLPRNETNLSQTAFPEATLKCM